MLPKVSNMCSVQMWFLLEEWLPLQNEAKSVRLFTSSLFLCLPSESLVLQRFIFQCAKCYSVIFLCINDVY